MRTLNVFDVLSKRALVTRSSARVIGGALAGSVSTDEGEVTLDFAGVDAVTPSFVDEVLAVVEDAISARGKSSFRLVFLNPPSRLSSKFSAVGRAHELSIEEAPDGAWIVTRPDATVS